MVNTHTHTIAQSHSLVQWEQAVTLGIHTHNELFFSQMTHFTTHTNTHSLTHTHKQQVVIIASCLQTIAPKGLMRRRIG